MKQGNATETRCADIWPQGLQRFGFKAKEKKKYRGLGHEVKSPIDPLSLKASTHTTMRTASHVAIVTWQNYPFEAYDNY